MIWLKLNKLKFILIELYIMAIYIQWWLDDECSMLVYGFIRVIESIRHLKSITKKSCMLT